MPVGSKINGSSSPVKNKVVNAETSYGYIMPWMGIQSVKTAAQFLKKGILLRYAANPFEVNGNKFDRGAVIILKTANRSFGNLWAEVRKIADENNIQLYPVSSGIVDKGYDFGSNNVRPFKAPKVALLTGEGIGSNAAGEIWHFFEQQIDYPITLINVVDISRIDWNEIDILIMPDGSYRFLNDKAALEIFKAWINRGGRVVALEGAVNGMAKVDPGNTPFSIKLKKTETTDKKDEKITYNVLKNLGPGQGFYTQHDAGINL